MPRAAFWRLGLFGRTRPKPPKANKSLSILLRSPAYLRPRAPRTPLGSFSAPGWLVGSGPGCYIGLSTEIGLQGWEWSGRERASPSPSPKEATSPTPTLPLTSSCSSMRYRRHRPISGAMRRHRASLRLSCRVASSQPCSKPPSNAVASASEPPAAATTWLRLGLGLGSGVASSSARARSAARPSLGPSCLVRVKG